MPVPNLEHAWIDKAKLIDYLLSPTHPQGWSKYAFLSHMGYSRSRWAQLAIDLRRHLRTQSLIAVEATAHGVKYVVRGSLQTPSGRSAVLVSVWIILATEDFPRFVTAFPGDRK